MVAASLSMRRPFLSQTLIKALNFHAITCLHVNAGEYRPCGVRVGAHLAPDHYRVSALMDDFISVVNREWESSDPVALATYVLWRLNNIHPFVNGNGRTARAASYFVLCIAARGWLPGTTILTELIKRDRAEYCVNLQHGNDTFRVLGDPDLAPLHAMVQRLLTEQLKPAGAGSPAPNLAALPSPTNAPLPRSHPILKPSPIRHPMSGDPAVDPSSRKLPTIA